jgi:hypothetical protein
MDGRVDAMGQAHAFKKLDSATLFDVRESKRREGSAPTE